MSILRNFYNRVIPGDESQKLAASMYALHGPYGFSKPFMGSLVLMDTQARRSFVGIERRNGDGKPVSTPYYPSESISHPLVDLLNSTAGIARVRTVEKASAITRTVLSVAALVAVGLPTLHAIVEANDNNEYLKTLPGCAAFTRPGVELEPVSMPAAQQAQKLGSTVCQTNGTLNIVVHP
jgi:hypothetical protein